MSCRACQRRLSEYLDGELGARPARGVEAHLRSCTVCAQVRDDLALLCAAARSLSLDAPVEGGAGGAGGDHVGGDDHDSGDCGDHVGGGHHDSGDGGGRDWLGDARWASIEAALDDDDAERAARARPWARLLPTALLGAAALSAVAGVLLLRGMTASAREGAAIDGALRAASAQALQANEERLDRQERELRLLVGDVIAGPAPGGGQDAPSRVPASTVRPPGGAAGFDALERRFAQRLRRDAAVLQRALAERPVVRSLEVVQVSLSLDRAAAGEATDRGPDLDPDPRRASRDGAWR